MAKKTSEAQIRANRNWEKRNKDKVRINGYQRSGRTFIRNHATEEDLKEYEKLIRMRREKLNNKDDIDK